MSIGTLVRKALGNKIFPVVGRYYRSFFVDLDKVAQFMSEVIPKDAHLLDIGGGDGEMLSHLMALRSDISATLIDLQLDIGASIPTEFSSRTRILPGTSIQQLDEIDIAHPNCIIISDVVHHIPPADRLEFFQDLFTLVQKTKATLLIKDVEPGYFISRLGYLSDRYISGDKSVSQISRAELCQLIEDTFGIIEIKEAGLFSEDKPNYLLLIINYS